jgi:hypothetical protein
LPRAQQRRQAAANCRRAARHLHHLSKNRSKKQREIKDHEVAEGAHEYLGVARKQRRVAEQHREQRR